METPLAGTPKVRLWPIAMYAAECQTANSRAWHVQIL